MRIFAISDIHVDFQENQKWIDSVSESDYKDDVLLLAGDVCHNLDRLQETLLHLRVKFIRLFFVPGNHDLWIHGEPFQNSLEKFETIMEFCITNDISIHSETLNNISVIPLFSWYTSPDDGDDSLYWPKLGEDKSNRMWSDNFFVKWPNSKFPRSASQYFFKLNNEKVSENYSGVIITMSHFIPRKEMMFGEYPPILDPERVKKYDRSPEFNFSRVAGSELIEKQIRQVGSSLHVYGHQHINRDRDIDGVRYVAHCLGYPNERKRGVTKGIEQGLKELIQI